MQSSEDLPARISAQGRTWLVTGVAGFIGSHLAEALLRAGQKVVGLDNFATGKRENLAFLKNQLSEKQWRSFRFLEGDIRSLDDCRAACRGVELVLHQAALGSVPRSIDDPISSVESNVNGFLNMLVAARDAGVERVVYASSSATYGDHPALPKVEPVIGKPASPYGMTKYVNELTAGIFAGCYGFPSVGLRYFNVFGPRQDPHGAYAAVIPAFFSTLILDKPSVIYGEGDTARDFCFIDNVVQANLLAATTDDPAAVNEVYNVACGEQTSLLELFDLVKAALAPRLPRVRHARPVHRETRRGDIKLSLADISKARRLLGYQPAWSVRQGLEKTAEWYLANLLPATEEKVAHV